MNEFIVWDNDTNKFVDDIDTVRYSWSSNFREIIEAVENHHSIFPYIGKKDINGKKIYTDSSIVKFDKIFAGGGNRIAQLKGCFFYSKEDLRYRIRTEHSGIIDYDYKMIKNLKVIGTLQQDKHLLGDEK